ncbi:MAG: serine hydrolase, partial [Rubrobacteraceae bacterium]
SVQEPLVQTVVSPDIASSGDLVLPESQASPEPASSESENPESENPEPETADAETGANLSGNPDALKKRIREIATYYGGVYGVTVTDPASGETVSFGSDETFFAASIGKLPTLLSLYKAAAQGEVDLDEEITMQTSDVQSYGTGVLHTNPVGYTLTLRKCAFHLINDSDNTAWVMLTRYLGEERIQADLTEIGAYDTGYWIPNTTTADDVQLMLEKISDPSFTSPELSEEMLYAMTDTFSEDRIPGGLPPDVRVAHKIGTYGTNFSDAGLVFEKNGDSEEAYSLVVFTDGMGETTARAAIQEISAAAHETFGPDSSR